ncbi:MAG: fibrillarin-like rRNA/tRNA 2'-O-methyltransferase [Nanoarchaeota archaeon]|nr:fibrillarin-like rRNA/tRNA 2'-O-methyltransferase [Nanoarchaeota archaeon]
MKVSRVVDNCLWILNKKRKVLATKNLTPGKTVYGEPVLKVKNKEYRVWNPNRSKLGAAIHKGIKKIPINQGNIVLYLGSASGTTVSHVSDIVGSSGLVYCVEIAPRVMRDLVFLAEERKNLAPILESAALTKNYENLVVQADFIFQDIAQKDQARIFIKNKRFLKKGGYAMIAVKARSIDVTKKPQTVFDEVEKELRKHFKIIDKKRLEPFEKDHSLFLVKNE